MADSQTRRTLRTVALVFSAICAGAYLLIGILYLALTLTGASVIVPPFDFGGTTLNITIEEVVIMSVIMMAVGVIQIIFAILNSKARNDNYKHIALGVLQIIFGDLVAGILVLCSGGDDKPAHVAHTK